MRTATRIIEAPEQFVGDAHVYELSVPYDGHGYVAVCVHDVDHGQWQNAGTEIIGCNSDGVILGSYVHSAWQSYVILTHAEALLSIGYTEVIP